MVNKVCFCLPFPFFFPTVCVSACTSPSPGVSVGVEDPLPFAFPPFPQAVVVVADSPKILRKDGLPPIAFLGTRVTDEVGNSGKADLDKTTGVTLLFAPGPGIEVGPLITGAAEDAIEAEAHGVLC